MTMGKLPLSSKAKYSVRSIGRKIPDTNTVIISIQVVLCSKKAEQAYNEGLPQIAAIHFAYAARFLLRVAEIVFYGNHIQTKDILRIFKRCRHFSRELQRMFPLWNYAPVFLKLSNLRDARFPIVTLT